MNVRKGYIINDQYATHFLTFTVVGWVDLFTRKECKEIIIDSLKYCNIHKGLDLNAFVIMPSHIHLIARAKESSDGLSAIIRDIKKYMSKELIKWALTSDKESRKEWLEMVFKFHAKYNKNNSSHQVWQQNNHPKLLEHPKFTMQKLNYVHFNPVEAGVVQEPEHYLYSSARNYADLEDVKIKMNVIDFGVQ